MKFFIILHLLLSIFSLCSAKTFECKFTKLQNYSSADSAVSCEISSVYKFKQFDITVNNTALEAAAELKEEDYVYDDMLNDYVKEFKLKSSNLGKIPVKIFEVFSQLDSFSAVNCGIKTLQAETFENASNLLQIHVQSNQIARIEYKVFESTRELKILDLSINEISKVHPKAFSHLEKLEDLNLSKNKITDLDDEIFANLRSLKTIGLESNKLTVIPSNLFTKLHKHLATISMSSNKIVAISPHVFDNLENLRFLMLSGNNCIDKSFSNNVIPDNVSIKLELNNCFKHYKKIFPLPEESFNITKNLNRLVKLSEICNYEFTSIRDGLKGMEKQLKELQKV